MHADADGNRIVLGDFVGFKSDTEQEGEVIALLPHGKLELYDEDGFSGSYLRYAKKTIVDSERVWVI